MMMLTQAQTAPPFDKMAERKYYLHEVLSGDLRPAYKDPVAMPRVLGGGNKQWNITYDAKFWHESHSVSREVFEEAVRAMGGELPPPC